MEALRKFEGSSLDELLEHVYRECGPQARILEANRVRRGGVGGFFAKEGFEVLVEPEPGHQAGEELPSPPPDPPPPPPEARARGRRLDLFDSDDDGDELVADLMNLNARGTAGPPEPAVTPIARGAGAHARPVAFDDVLEETLLMGEPDEELTMTSRLTDDDLHVLLDRVQRANDEEPIVVEDAAPDRAPDEPEPRPDPVESPRADRPVTTTSVLRRGEAVLTRSGPPPAPPAPAAPTVAELAPTAGSRALDLAARYASVPQAPPFPTGPGAVVVVGYRGEAMAVGEHLAADTGGRVVLASNRPVPGDAAIVPLRTADEALDRVRPKGKTGRRVRTTEHLVLVVDLGGGPSGLLFAQQVLEAVKAEQVRLAINVEEDRDDIDATIQLLGSVDAIDVVLPDHGISGLDPTPLLSLSVPVATIDGLPTSAGLWAALTLEMEGTNDG